MSFKKFLESVDESEPKITDYKRITGKGEDETTFQDKIYITYKDKKYIITQNFYKGTHMKSAIFNSISLYAKESGSKYRVVDLKPGDFLLSGGDFYVSLKTNQLSVDKDTIKVLMLGLLSQKKREQIIASFQLKPETKKHFGEFLTNLEESVETERFKVLKVKKKDEVFNYDVLDKSTNKRYKLYTTDDNDSIKESEVYLHEPELKGTGTHGQLIHSGLTLLATVVGNNFYSEFKSIPYLKGNSRTKDVKDLFELGKFLNELKNSHLKNLIHVQKMKPKTREIFGDIVSNLS